MASSLVLQSSDLHPLEMSEQIIKEEVEDSEKEDEKFGLGEEFNKAFKDNFYTSLTSPNFIPHRNAFIINFSVSMALSKDKKWIQKYNMKPESEGSGAKLSLLMINNFELYQNNFSTNLEELFEVR